MEKGQGNGTDTLQTDNVFTRKEYIEREAALNALCYGCCENGECEIECAMWDAIASIPAADVRPVVRGKWEVGGMFDDIGRCSNCHYMFPIDTAMTEFHFCPNCGADMREES